MDPAVSVSVLTTKEEKQESRLLYHQVFAEDPEAFLDYYYSDRAKDNKIAVKRISGRIVSMAHLNPVRMMVMGQEVKTYYIFAVATAAEERHKGHMRDVLECAFGEMEAENIPFCYLIPVDEAIYRPFGFETICSFSGDAGLTEDALRSSYDIYIKETEDYCRRRMREAEITAMYGEEGVPENPVIMARVVSRRAFAAMSALPEETAEQDMLHWLRERRIYISEDV